MTGNIFDHRERLRRRRGYSEAEAQDLTQELFKRLLERQFLSGLLREGGRFRSFLLTALNHFLAEHWQRSRAQKRAMEGSRLSPSMRRPLKSGSGSNRATNALLKQFMSIIRRWRCSSQSHPVAVKCR